MWWLGAASLLTGEAQTPAASSTADAELTADFSNETTMQFQTWLLGIGLPDVRRAYYSETVGSDPTSPRGLDEYAMSTHHRSTSGKLNYTHHRLLYIAGLDSEGSDNNPANSFFRNFGFIDLPDECRRLLVPMVKVYKTFLNAETDEKIDLRIKTDYHDNGVGRVELEKIDFTRLGGNPAEVDSNINFNISLSARELGFYLKRQYPLSEQGGTDLRTRDLEAAGVAWIDLIKIDPGRSLDVNTTSEDDEVTNQSDVRIRVELGYQTPVDSQKPATMSQDDWLHWKRIISKQKEEFHLSLFKHNFDFKSSGEVGLSIDFKASATAKMLDPEADLLIEPAANAQIKRLVIERRLKKRQFKNLEEEADDDCVQALKDSIGEYDRDIALLERKMRNRVLTQIYQAAILAAGSTPNKTRVWQRAIIDGSAAHVSRAMASAQYEMRPYEPEGDQRLRYEVSSVGTGDALEFEEFDNGAGTRKQYVLLGDIIQAALEVVAENYRFGGGRLASPDMFGVQFIEPMTVARVRDLYQEIGSVGLGKVRYTNPNDTSKITSLEMRKLPISLDLFRRWYSDKISSRKSLSLRDFIQLLFSNFVSNVVFKGLEYDVTDAEDEPISVEFSILSQKVDEEYQSAHPDRFQWQDQDWGTPSSVLIVQQTTPPTEQELDSLPQLLWGQSTRGIMESVKFERADIPGYAEARLFSDRQSTSNNLAIREKYNATINMIGNTVFFPGCQLNLLPEPLDLGFADEAGSIARSLGLGGIFVVHRTENQIDMARGSWDTQLITKWESSAAAPSSDSQSNSTVAAHCTELSAEATAAEAPAILETAATGVSNDLQIDDTPRPLQTAGEIVVNPETGQTLDELQEALGMNPAQSLQG